MRWSYIDCTWFSLISYCKTFFLNEQITERKDNEIFIALNFLVLIVDS